MVDVELSHNSRVLTPAVQVGLVMQSGRTIWKALRVERIVDIYLEDTDITGVISFHSGISGEKVMEDLSFI